MLEGERGSGKSTIAVLLAKKFGAIEDNIEVINCGDFRKIDDTREAIRNLTKSSIFGRKKVLVLDEVHQLSKDSQQAWLIPLQEYEKMDTTDTLIIACTTTTGKLLDTFLRRFLRFKVTKLTKTTSLELIDRVCKENNIELSIPAKKLLISESGGIAGFIVYNIHKIVGVDSLEDIEYLLSTTTLEGQEELVTLLNLIAKSSQWKVIANSLKSLLVEQTPEELRIGLMNLISGNFLSNYYNEASGKIYQELYNNLYKFSGFPEKANLISAIHKTVKEK
jgi:DNA polymerase-3 subunit gamma/tau